MPWGRSTRRVTAGSRMVTVAESAWTTRGGVPGCHWMAPGPLFGGAGGDARFVGRFSAARAACSPGGGGASGGRCGSSSLVAVATRVVTATATVATGWTATAEPTIWSGSRASSAISSGAAAGLRGESYDNALAQRPCRNDHRELQDHSSETGTPGEASTTSNSQPWNTSTGSTTNDSSTTSAASHQPKPKTSTTVNNTQAARPTLTQNSLRGTGGGSRRRHGKRLVVVVSCATFPQSAVSPVRR